MNSRTGADRIDERSGQPSAPPLPRDLKDFRNYHSGETILVCGCGTSLNEVVSPGRFITIGVNDVGRLFQPDYLVVLNPRQQFKPDRFRFVEQSRAKAIFTQLDLGIRHPHIVRFRLGRLGGVDFSDPTCLPHTRNSPYVAVCLAIHMGAEKIGLIGVDFTHDHFFGATGEHPLSRQFAQIDEEYKRLYEASGRLGVEILNLSSCSRLRALPKMSPEHFASGRRTATALGQKSLKIVSYSATPVAGVPAILSRCIAARTDHGCRTVWSNNAYSNGMTFEGDIEWRARPAEAEEQLRSADLLIVHNGKVADCHRPLLRNKPVITMAHNYMWNVDATFVREGFPGLVVGQYQAALPEFKHWSIVPNPIPLWEPAFQPGPKHEQITICYTPSGKHATYPPEHRLYWHSKGYDTTMRVLERLAQRFPIRLEVIRGQQVPHHESLAMKRRAHIVIDECVTGSYHRNSLEGLAVGCVVVNGMGRLPQVVEAFAECASGDAEMPFMCTAIEDLERVLTGLIELGKDALLCQGMRNRAWMEQHWDFARQWPRFWEPAIAAALEKSRDRLPATPVASTPDGSARSNAAAMAPAQGVSVVVCHGGEERLPQLQATLVNLRRCGGVSEVIVCDLGDRPWARDLARSLADKYIFAPNEGAFERARCLNVGTSIAEYDLVLWIDNDLIVPADFIGNAAREMRARQLDYMIPYAAVNYLTEQDTRKVIDGTVEASACRPLKIYKALYVCGGAGLVRRSFVIANGGLSEMFRGWGGEDGAWWHKARLLGRAEVVRGHSQCMYHLFHDNCGANGGSQHRDSNPHYADNVALLQQMRSIRDCHSYLKRFPPQSLFAAAWKEKKILLVHDDADEIDTLCSSQQIGGALAEVTGIQVEHRSIDGTFDAQSPLQPDALVVFGAAATASASAKFPPELWHKTVVAHSGSLLQEAVLQRLEKAAGVLCSDDSDRQALQAAGVLPWPISRQTGSLDPAHGLAIRILQPLSIVLGGVMPHTVPITRNAEERADFGRLQSQRSPSSMRDISILITSFLRPGYLKDCLAGIERNLPECAVIVVDDSGDQHGRIETDHRFVHLPFDSGLSAKRNAGVEACKTKYLLMGSDDFDFSTVEVREGINKLVRALEEHPTIDVAGGHHNNQPYEGFLEMVSGLYIKETRLFSRNDPQVTQSLSPDYEIYKVDLIVNYFLARTESIRQFPWDERMKIGGEHGDWFMTLKHASKTVVWVPGVNINELPRGGGKEHADYAKYRGRALTLGHRLFLEKQGVKHYFDFDTPVPGSLRSVARTLIAVVTCRHEQYVDRVRAQRETWIPMALAAGYSVEIFDGERLRVPDDYYSLIPKTQAICAWALKHGYERLLKVDDDCSIWVDRLTPSLFDYAGIPIAANDCGSTVPPGAPARPRGTYPHKYASGGAYWLSRKAMTIIADAKPNGDWAEDRFVGNVLAKRGIFVQRIQGYLAFTAERLPQDWTVLTQLPPTLMRDLARSEQAAGEVATTVTMDGL